jgi:hypothetical protein
MRSLYRQKSPFEYPQPGNRFLSRDHVRRGLGPGNDVAHSEKAVAELGVTPDQLEMFLLMFGPMLK